jgi:membrane-associated phospholipid phosphatase
MSSTTAGGPWARPFRFRCVIPLVAVLAPLFLAGCGTLKNGRGWGQDAGWPVDVGRIARAGRDALLSPATLVPLAGAGVFALGDLDEKVSDWASEHHPLFGSQSGAADASNYMVGVLGAEAFATALATPSGDTPGAWALAKLKGGAVEAGAVAATGALSGWLKDGSNRMRPDGSDNESFPSGHSALAFSFATLANRNLDSIDFLGDFRTPLQITNTVLASGVAWARVEAHKHHPSDVLFGAALGHFLTAFIHDAFLNLPEDGNFDFAFFSTGDGLGLSLEFRF